MHFVKNKYVQINATEVNLHNKFAFRPYEILGVAIIGTIFEISIDCTHCCFKLIN